MIKHIPEGKEERMDSATVGSRWMIMTSLPDWYVSPDARRVSYDAVSPS